ncbi:hypothetical protein BaRGS_00031671, partial [Batillaria attramentaria]
MEAMDRLVAHAKSSGAHKAPAPDGWEPVIDRAHLKVYGTFSDISATAFYNTQMDLEFWSAWDKQTMEITVVDHEAKSSSEVIHWVYKFPYPMYPRDYCYVRRYRVDPQSRQMLIMARAVEHPRCPTVTKFVRVTEYQSQMNGFDYYLTYFDDPQTQLPSVCYNWLASTGVPEFVERLHTASKLMQEPYLNKPFALVASFIDPSDSAMPWPITSYPHIISTLPGKMSFGQRFANAVMYSMVRPLVLLLETLYQQGDDFGAELAQFDYGAAMKNAVLYLDNSDNVLDYPKAVYPNFVQVRGLTTGPAKPLPGELKTWFDGAFDDGVVVVSLGSQLYNIFKVKAKVVMRLNVQNAKVKVPDHVMTVDWFPQNDALGHPNTRLFVSHCGKNGFFEGLYHGVPILCIPFNGDAYGTGVRVQAFGVGGSVDVLTSSADDIAHIVNSLIDDSDVHQRMKTAATLFHDRPETPAQRAATALEHVSKYGGEHLRPSSWELPFTHSPFLFLVAGFYLFHVQTAHAYSYMLVPLPFMSHCLEMAAIGRELHSRGHDVHLLAPDFFPAEKCVKGDAEGIKIQKFKMDSEAAEFLVSNIAKATGKMGTDEGGALHLVNTFTTLIPAICRGFSQALPVLDRFKGDGSTSKSSETEGTRTSRSSTANKSAHGSRANVDIVLIDGRAVARCLTLIPAYLNKPFALVASLIDPSDSAMPWPITSYPHIISTLPGKMSFGQRFANAVMYSMVRPLVLLLETLYQQGDDFGAELAQFDYGAAMKNAVLYLENSDNVLDYPKAVYPNFVQVGGLTAGPAKPLPGELKTWFDGAFDDGVVVVSLGSSLYNMSAEMADKLISAMAKVKAKVVMRLNVQNAKVKVPDHVMTVDWFPQNDALGHPNTRLFVSHCGKNGFFEGLYHGVPILCVPFNGDAYGTGVRVQAFGVGGSVDLLTSSADDIAHIVNSLIDDNDVHQRMKKAATLFHDRPETPAQRAATALEHVSKYGGEHLRPSSARTTIMASTTFRMTTCLLSLVLTSHVTTVTSAPKRDRRSDDSDPLEAVVSGLSQTVSQLTAQLQAQGAQISALDTRVGEHTVMRHGDGDTVQLDLYKGSTRLVVAYGCCSTYNSGSNLATVHLNKGETVHVQIDTGTMLWGGHTSFSGF